MAGVGALLDDEAALGATVDTTKSKGFGIGAMLDDEANQDLQRVKQSVNVAVKTPPEQAAKVRQLVDASGLPPGVVDRNTDQVAQQQRANDIMQAVQASPVLRRQMADPNFAQIAQDDTANLSVLEKLSRTYLGASVKSGTYSLLGTGARLLETVLPTTSEADVAALFKDRPAELQKFLDESPAMGLQRFGRAMQQASNAAMADLSPDAKLDYGNLKYATTDLKNAAYLSPIKMVGDALQSLPTSLAFMISAYVTKGVATRAEAQAIELGATPEVARQTAIHAASETMAKLGAATEGMAGYGQQAISTREELDQVAQAKVDQSPEFQKLVRSGYSPEAARIRLSGIAAEEAGVSGGIADAITNFYGGKFFGKVLAEGGSIVPRAAKGFLTEGATEAVQGGLEQGGQNAATQSVDPSQSLLDNVAESIVQGMFVGGLTGGSFSAVLGRKSQIEKAQTDAEQLNELLKTAGLSQLRERSPASFANFVNEAAADGPVPAVFIDAQTFAQAAQQAGLDVAKLMPETSAALQDALDTKSDVRIPIGEFAAALPGTTLEQSLVPLMRTSVDGPTQQETQDKKWVEETQAQTEKILADHTFNEQWKEMTATVETELYTQLQQANRFTAEVNRAYAGFMSAFYATNAARLGITPEQMYVKYPLQIRAQSVDTGSTLGQRTLTEADVQAVADKIREELGVHTLDLHLEKSGDIKLDTIATEKTGTGAGTQAMQRVIDFADEHGRRITLSLAEKGYQPIEGGPKTSSPDRLRAFYKRFGFADNKGRKKDFTVRESMIREPQQLKQSIKAEDRTIEVDGVRRPITNSEGQLLHTTPEGQRAFWRWFGDSKVVDANGRPLVVYHGTQADFSTFDQDNPRSVSVQDQGYFFTNDPKVASDHASADWWRDSPQPNVMPVYLSIQNPDVEEHIREPSRWYDDNGPKRVESARRNGNDGLVIGSDIRLYVAFTARQIKSAIGNSGAFDPNNADILKQAAHVETDAFKTWSHNAPFISSADASTHQFKTGEAIVVEAYHGTKRPDRVGTQFKKKRATSGPMAFHTSNSTLASSYASNKQDTSLSYEDTNFEQWFKYKPEGQRTAVDLDRAWYFLPPEVRQHVGATLPHVVNHTPEGDEMDGYRVDEKDYGLSGKDHWDHEIKQAHGNVLKAAKEIWLNGGSLFRSEEEFMQVLKLGGMPMADMTFDSPHAEFPFVYKNYIAMQNPLVTTDVPQTVVDALTVAAKRDRSRAARGGADMWDKNTRTLKEWVANYTDPDNKDNSYVWSSIPDKVTEVFRSLGYDGIVDRSGKGGGEQHPVYIPFDETQVKSAIGNKGKYSGDKKDILKQPAQAGDRGSITLQGDIKQTAPIITLLPNADLSTFLHESGHFYLEVLADMAAQPEAPAQIVDDFNKVLAWFGVPDAATWHGMTLEEKRPHHEQFARGFESYIFEGKAPNTELNSVFARFRAWMINVYKQLRALNVELSDEVRSVMDRLIATNEEIIAAETARNYTPLFAEKPPGMSDAEWQAYQELGVDATQEAVDQLQTRSARDMKFASNAKSRAIKEMQKQADAKRAEVKAEVTAEVKAEPIYRAFEFFRHGIETEETAPHLLASSKLDSAAVDAMYSPGVMNTPDLAKLKGMMSKDGISPDMAAELFGFSSGDELIRKLAELEPMQEKIAGITDQRMLERYGDLTDPQAIERAANEAVHNEVRGRFVATELNALSKAVGERKTLLKAAKDFAAQIIARKKIKDVRPNVYAAAETRAARNAEAATKKNDLVTAAAEKRNQLVNLYATKAAYDAQNEVEKAVRYLKRMDGNTAIDADYREQIEAILERFDLRSAATRKGDVKRKTLAEWVEQQKDIGFDPVVAAELIDSNMAQHYSTLTVEEFRGIVDTVKNIEHLGRLKKKLLTAKDNREFAAVVEDAAKAIEENAKRTIEQPLERNTWLAKMKEGVTEFFAMHRKFASMIREMDGFKDNGVLWNIFSRPMNEAANSEAVLRENATIELQKLFEPIFASGKMSAKVFIPEINASLSREGRIMVALNAGNEGNLQRLMDGDKWTMPQVQAVLDTLTKQEMDFVQSVWDFVGTFKKDIGEQQRRLTGIAPEWVEPREVITKHGAYRGGYIPAKYDTTRSTRSLSDEAAAGLMDAWRAKRGAAKTRDSFTKDRANRVVDRPLRKDFGVITQHVTEVTHRLAWQEFLVDANRLVRASKIDGAIRDHYGPEVLKAMRDTLEDIAAGEVGAQNAFERGINYLRTGATIAGLGWRITTSLLQPIGLTQSMVRIGPKYVAKGLAEWLGDSAKMENTAKKIYAKSDMMRLRGKTMQREISEIMNQVRGKSSAIEASYFYLIQKMQLVADIPTWLGQYNKAIEQGAAEDNAVAQADQAVIDAQGAGQIKDLAAIQRGGPLLKLFTNFYSFFNTTYNLTSEAFGRTKFSNPLSVGRLAVDMLLLYSVPAVLGTLMKAALHGDENDEKKLLRQLIADQLTYLFGTMVGLRELAGAIQTAAGLPGDYQGPASVRVFAELAKLGKQLGQGEVDEALLKAANNVGGILFHYPAGQINSTADGLVTMAQGKTQNPGALLVGSNK